MNKFLKYGLLNIILSCIVALIGYSILYQIHKKEVESSVNQKINMHAKQVETFITDVVSSINSISTMAYYEKDNKKINDNMAQIKQSDPRIINLYVLNEDAIAVNSSSELMLNKKVESLAFFYQYADVNLVSISKVRKNLLNESVVYISKPIVNSKNKVFVVAEIDINTIGTVIDTIEKNSNITIKDLDGGKIFESKDKLPYIYSKSLIFQKAPWSLTISSGADTKMTTIQESFAIFIISCMIITIIQAVYFYVQEKNRTLQMIDDINKQKKEMIGLMAANTAHEIKNPLTSVIGFMDIIQMKYDNQHQNPHFDIVKSELKRINNIVGQFLLLGKPTKVESEVHNIVNIVKEVVQLLQYEFDYSRIKLIIKYDDNDIFVDIPEDQFTQVMINILQNAKDAMDTNRISTIQMVVGKDRENAFISVKDNGIGMDAKSLHQLFDPFFTTKDNGTGLGMSVTKGIIESNHGQIHVNSQVNIGTEIFITFPLASPNNYEI